MTNKDAVTNIPIHDPLYSLPYEHKGSRYFVAYCQTSEDSIRELLEGTPFQYVSNMYEVYVAHHPDVRGGSARRLEYTFGPYREAGIHIAAKYKNVLGTYTAYMYVTSDAAMASARETFGYPKKLADIEFNEAEGQLTGKVRRDGIPILDLCGSAAGGKQIDLPPEFSGPRLLLKVIPKADGPGHLVRKVVIREAPKRLKLYSRTFGQATVTLGGSGTDPLYKLTPTKIIMASFSVGDLPFAWATAEEDF